MRQSHPAHYPHRDGTNSRGLRRGRPFGSRGAQQPTYQRKTPLANESAAVPPSPPDIAPAPEPTQKSEEPATKPVEETESSPAEKMQRRHTEDCRSEMCAQTDASGESSAIDPKSAQVIEELTRTKDKAHDFVVSLSREERDRVEEDQQSRAGAAARKAAPRGGRGEALQSPLFAGAGPTDR